MPEQVPARERFLLPLSRAYALGALSGLAIYLFEVAVTRTEFRLGAIGFYSLIPAVGAAAIWLVSRPLLPRPIADTLVALTVPSCVSILPLYYLNVVLLAGTPYLSPSSLALSAATWLTIVALLLALRRLWRLKAAGKRRVEIGHLGVPLVLFHLAVVALPAWYQRGDEPEGSGSGPNLALIVVDSARFDHMSAHGYHRVTSPAYDGLSASSRVFQSAYSASSWTAPSVDWLFRSTGGSTLRLPQLLGRRGYVSGAFSDNPHLGRRSDVMRGFHHVERSEAGWRYHVSMTVVGKTLDRVAPGSDRKLVDRAIAWAEQKRGPFFLYLHLMDSHAPYDSPPIDGLERPGRRIEFPATGMDLSETEIEDIVARYDGGILSADRELDRAIRAIRSTNRPFLAIITSDHGESLGERGRWFHGGSLAPELLSVPLLVFGQGVVPGTVPGAFGFDSIPHTLLEAAGIGCSHCPGSDLRTASEGDVVEGGLPPRLRYRIQDGYKIIVDFDSKRTHLFDLQSDPQELEDIADDHPDLAARLSVGLEEPLTLPDPDPADLDRIEALGYFNR